MRKRGYLITCLVVALLISSCGNRSSITEVVSSKKTEENQETSALTTKTIFTCEYPKKFERERKKVFDYMQNVFEKNNEYVFLEENGNGFKQTLSASRYVYYGKIKDGRPEGMGLIVIQSRTQEALFNVGAYIPFYVGNFKKGKYDGYGMGFNDNGVEYEGNHKKGNTSGECIIYEGVDILTVPVSSEWEEYWKTKHDDEVLFDFPVYQPCVAYEGISKGTQLKDNDCKVYSSVYEKDEYAGVVRKYKGIYGPLEYEGGIRGGKYHGKGREYYASGKVKYDGEYKNGKRDGKGILYNEDGSVNYKGKFKNGNIK